MKGLKLNSLPRMIFNKICLPESFNTNISHQLLDYTISIGNSQHNRTQIQNVILYSKPDFKRSFQRFMKYKNKSDSDLVWQIQLISIKG